LALYFTAGDFDGSDNLSLYKTCTFNQQLFADSIISCPSLVIMEEETADAILAHHDSLRSWPQPFMFDTPHGLVDLTCAMGKNASTPENVAMYQPAVYPSWPYHQSVYCFDPKSYCGRCAKEQLIFDIRKSLVGVNFFSNNTHDCKLYRMIKLVCSFSKQLSKATLY
jgi:hypothetical protein